MGGFSLTNCSRLIKIWLGHSAHQGTGEPWLYTPQTSIPHQPTGEPWLDATDQYPTQTTSGEP